MVLPLACAQDDPARPRAILPPAEATPRAFLVTPETLAVGPDSAIAVTAHKDIGGEATEVATVPVTGGDVVIRAAADGSLAIDELALTLADVAISSMNIGLTRLEVRLAQMTGGSTAWSPDDRSAVATAVVDLELAWALQAFGRTLPLGDIRVSGLPMTMTLSGRGGHVSVTLQGQKDGQFWSWAGLVELADLGVHLEAETR